MHDPWSVAFEIKSPFKNKHGYRNSLITIWHVDPESDGTDDSCGRFIRNRHANQNILGEIKKEFDFNFKHNYWFNKEGKQIFSTTGTVLLMYRTAAWIHFKRNKKKVDKFFRKNLHDIMFFSENPIDCIGDMIVDKWGYEKSERGFEERFGCLAGIVYTDILRKERKWYNDPKWHIYHWKIRLNFLRYFLKYIKKNKKQQTSDNNLINTV